MAVKNHWKPVRAVLMANIIPALDIVLQKY